MCDDRIDHRIRPNFIDRNITLNNTWFLIDVMVIYHFYKEW